MNYYFVGDVETGGLDYTKNPITELALSVLEPKELKVVDKLQFYVKPYDGLKIDKIALEKTQVSMKDIENGYNYTKVIQELVNFSKKYTTGRGRYKPIWVGHNFQFDWDFIQYLIALKDKSMKDLFDGTHMCTMKMMQAYEQGDKKNEKNKYKLELCCSRMGIELKSAHGASADVDATEQLFVSLITLLRQKDVKNITRDKKKTVKQRSKFEM